MNKTSTRAMTREEFLALPYKERVKILKKLKNQYNDKSSDGKIIDTYFTQN